MEIKKDEKTGMFSLEGMSEGKLLYLNRVLADKYSEQGSGSYGLLEDLHIAVNKGVNKYIPYGAKWG